MNHSPMVISLFGLLVGFSVGCFGFVVWGCALVFSVVCWLVVVLGWTFVFDEIRLPSLVHMKLPVL